MWPLASSLLVQCQGPESCTRAVLSRPGLALLGPLGGAGLTRFRFPSSPEAEEQPMEVSVCRSPGLVLSISQEPGEQRASWGSGGVGCGALRSATPTCPPVFSLGG